MRSLSPTTAGKLFATGMTVGPIVDSLHNQCLLRYNLWPIEITYPSFLSISHATTTTATSTTLTATTTPLFCSSWIVPPLLGIAYLVLGGILPRLCEDMLTFVGKVQKSGSSTTTTTATTATTTTTTTTTTTSSQDLQKRAYLAVLSTAAIIKVSELLETTTITTTTTTMTSISSSTSAEIKILILMILALSQWAILDTTLVALLVASFLSILGPLSELPFVAYGVWEYVPTAADYQPLYDIFQFLRQTTNISSNNDETIIIEYAKHLSLSSITGPCYFAVTMDAIALGRWFDADQEKNSNPQ